MIRLSLDTLWTLHTDDCYAGAIELIHDVNWIGMMEDRCEILYDGRVDQIQIVQLKIKETEYEQRND